VSCRQNERRNTNEHGQDVRLRRRAEPEAAGALHGGR